MPRAKAKNGIKKVGIITKHNIRQNADYLKKLVEALRKYDKDIYLDEHGEAIAGKIAGAKKAYEKSQLLRKCDLVIVLGGDGTLLKTARQSVRGRAPLIAGVNMGHLGFLTGFSPSKLLTSLPRIFSKKFSLDERFLLRVTVYRNNKKRFTTLALNDAVINQGGFARLVNLHVEVDQRKLATFRADGLIIATPTGSTGHSISAGGPIVHPRIAGFILTPLCPIKLGVRPIIIPNTRQFIVRLETQWRAEKKPIVLTIDGQLTYNLKKDDVIRLRKSSRIFNMIRMGGHNYYRMLRQKLNWGE